MKKIINSGNGTVIKSWSYAPVRESEPVGKLFQLREYASFYLTMAGILALAVYATLALFAPEALQTISSYVQAVLS